ncbi:glycosyltransferase family 2 protein [Sphingomonas oligophenolica]|uniref:Glycosyltransferase family 2 protein n=1 Tax=Sphingomonas oligophenolica TaxID=301154 RepID=A0ABU9XXG5_9SPHN
MIVPFFNERACIAETIASLAQQTMPFRLLLVDNGSTDDSAAIADKAARVHALDYTIVTEPSAGKVSALRAGLRETHTRWIATCDADTLYPPQYLAAASAQLARSGCVVTGAYRVPRGAGPIKRAAKAWQIRNTARLLRRQSHSGGWGQAFCTGSLCAVGGFDPSVWNFVLEDHEVIHRLMRQGRMRYSNDLWCMPSPRKRDRDSVRWTFIERLTYSLVAPWAGDWYFYSFLSRRLQRRKLFSHRLRERQYQQPDERPLFASRPIDVTIATQANRETGHRLGA